MTRFHRSPPLKAAVREGINDIRMSGPGGVFGDTPVPTEDAGMAAELGGAPHLDFLLRPPISNIDIMNRGSILDL